MPHCSSNSTRDSISRYHVSDLTVAKLIDLLMISSSGLKIKLFERFSKAWNNIDVSCDDSGINEKYIAVDLVPIKEDLLVFIRHQLQVYHQRDDYQELLQLALLFLLPWR